MTRMHYNDVINELLDLCQEIEQDILQQLAYYRASVYKQETRTDIDARLSQLQEIVSLFADAEVTDLFADYEASAGGNCQIAGPGECQLTIRIARLFSGLHHAFATTRQLPKDTFEDRNLVDRVYQNKRKLAKVCQHRSRRRRFFETL